MTVALLPLQSSGDASAILVLGVLVVLIWMVAKAAKSSPKRRDRTYRPATPPRHKVKTTKKSPNNNWGLSDPSNQVKAISKVSFEKRRLMNKSEYRVFAELEKIVIEAGSGHRVMAQTCLGELISPSKTSGDWKERKDAYASINSKRLDFAIIDRFGMLALAIEYQGSGHYHQESFIRDAVKREALRRAGVQLLEVPKGRKPSELRAQVVRVLQGGVGAEPKDLQSATAS